MITAIDIAAPLTGLAEGLRLQAYQDSGGVWTVGIGHTGSDVTPGMFITSDQAWKWFAEDQSKLLALLGTLPPLEGAAMLDFGFNCGMGALEKILAGQDTIDNPVHTKDRRGNTLGGLVARDPGLG